MVFKIPSNWNHSIPCLRVLPLQACHPTKARLGNSTPSAHQAVLIPSYYILRSTSIQRALFCCSSSTSDKGNCGVGKKKLRLWPGEEFFPVYHYFNSRLHDSDSAKSRKGWCELQGIISTESQVPGLGRTKEGLFSLQLKEVKGRRTQKCSVFAAGFLPARGDRNARRPQQPMFSPDAICWLNRLGNAGLTLAETAHRHESNHKASLHNICRVLRKPLRKTRNKNAQNCFIGLKLGKGWKLICS